MEKIEHIVVLMLENRSFDSILGKLYPKSANFNGLSGSEYNIHKGEKIFVWEDPQWGIHPQKDPAEHFDGMNQQIFNLPKPSNVVPPHAIANMGGFCNSYALTNPLSPVREVMHYYTPEEVPSLSYLARQYAVSDAWFASSPTQTFPNRFFLHTGTAGGYENNIPLHFPYLMPSIFSKFNHKNIPNGWKIYFGDFPLASLISDTWNYPEHFQQYKQFQNDLNNNALPKYSFIEPNYLTTEDYPKDCAPTHHVQIADNLVAEIYNSLRNSLYFTKTLLIILYDEHGGTYDHVPPPPVIPPESPRKDQVFAFDRLGCRVPAVVVSPYIPKGTIFRAPEGSQPFDHTSVIQTLRKRFDLGPPLTQRDANAPDLFSLLSLSAPTNLGLKELPQIPIPETLFSNRKLLPMTNLAKQIQLIAPYLPDFSKITDVNEHIRTLVTKPVDIIEDHDQAWEKIKSHLRNTFKHLKF